MVRNCVDLRKIVRFNCHPTCKDKRREPFKVKVLGRVYKVCCNGFLAFEKSEDS